MRTTLLQLHIGQPVHCHAWHNVPVMKGIQIAIYANQGNWQVQSCARICFGLLERYFAMLGGHKGNAPCGDSTTVNFPTNCYASNEPINRFLIYISDGTPHVDAGIHAYFSVPGSTVVPIVDRSFGTNIQAILPNGMRNQLAQTTDYFRIEPLIPQILRAAAIQTNNFSLFISYVHADAASIAGQLFHKLVEKQFDVFLDRFSSRTGDNFVTLIKEELADKAFVLVLETARIKDSKYCRQEVATAEAYKLGLLAVDLPGSRQIFHAPLHRFDLRSKQLMPDHTLSTKQLDDIVKFVIDHYDAEVSRRIRYLDKLLYGCLMTNGLIPQQVGAGLYLADNGHRKYLINMCRRIPVVEDFILLEEQAALQLPNESVLFGPVAAARTFRGNEINWIGKKSRILPLEEGHLFRSARRIAANQSL